MRTFTLALLVSLTVATSVALADETPRVLRRKVDGVVVGVGYTDFSGVANLSDYDVVPVTPGEVTAYSQQIQARLRQEQSAARQAQQQANRARAQAIQQKLGLTPADLADLKAALED